jgi:hypothetical protein
MDKATPSLNPVAQVTTTNVVSTTSSPELQPAFFRLVSTHGWTRLKQTRSTRNDVVQSACNAALFWFAENKRSVQILRTNGFKNLKETWSRDDTEAFMPVLMDHLADQIGWPGNDEVFSVQDLLTYIEQETRSSERPTFLSLLNTYSRFTVFCAVGALFESLVEGETLEAFNKTCCQVSKIVTGCACTIVKPQDVDFYIRLALMWPFVTRDVLDKMCTSDWLGSMASARNFFSATMTNGDWGQTRRVL